MDTIIIKNATLIGGQTADILIRDNKFAAIKPNINFQADKTIDATDKAVIPAFYNAHTHAAMSLLRGYGEGLNLADWLSAVWKKEATLSNEDYYNGTRLAALEMIKSGTVFFNDMYFKSPLVLAAVRDMGIRARIGMTFMDSMNSETYNDNIDFIEHFDRTNNEMIDIAIAPHSIYTCSSELYLKCFELAQKHNLTLHTHIAETQKEVNDCLKEHRMTPVQYLSSLGILNSRTIAAHCVHLTQQDAEILAANKVTVVHNPCSNMKLASGIFPYKLHKAAGTHIALGTDGSASNNSLSMLGEMKAASLLAKVSSQDAQALPAEEVFKWATSNSAQAFGINAGRIEIGYLADCLLIDLNGVSFVPEHNIISSLVYASDTQCINSVICNGKILMENHIVPKEREIIAAAKKFIK